MKTSFKELNRYFQDNDIFKDAFKSAAGYDNFVDILIANGWTEKEWALAVSKRQAFVLEMRVAKRKKHHGP